MIDIYKILEAEMTNENTTVKKITIEIKELYSELMKAGFSESQSFQLIIAILK